MLRTKVVDEILKNSIFPPFFLNGTIDVLVWKNIVETDRPHTTIWRMRIACSITDPTHTHTHTHTHTQNM